jgi:hypothetical protein
MPNATKCPECGAVIAYDLPEEIVCQCGWSGEAESEAEFKGAVQQRCESLGLSYQDLIRDFGDPEVIAGYLRALEDD